MTDREALISLNFANIGSCRLRQLLEHYDRPANIFKSPPDKLRILLKNVNLEREIESAGKLGLKIITLNETLYPEKLKEIYDPPIVLYVRGEFKEEDKFSIAIVGSRRASYYGLSNAEKFAGELSGFGITIVSGLARGIDTAAHKGAVRNKKRTIAVMGSGFNHIYPEENKRLVDEITENGAVISEFPLDFGPLKQNFPRRNRVISGLSLGVLVVEAGRNSGALITADFALEQGREVFALPGKADSDTSFGTNGLIRQGAKMVLGAEDILKELNLKLDTERQESYKNRILHINLGQDEEVLYNVISSEPVSFDDIIEKTKIAPQAALSILFKLEMKKIIKQLAGKNFVRNNPTERN